MSPSDVLELEYDLRIYSSDVSVLYYDLSLQQSYPSLYVYEVSSDTYTQLDFSTTLTSPIPYDDFFNDAYLLSKVTISGDITLNANEITVIRNQVSPLGYDVTFFGTRDLYYGVGTVRLYTDDYVPIEPIVITYDVTTPAIEKLPLINPTDLKQYCTFYADYREVPHFLFMASLKDLGNYSYEVYYYYTYTDPIHGTVTARTPTYTIESDVKPIELFASKKVDTYVAWVSGFNPNDRDDVNTFTYTLRSLLHTRKEIL